MAERIRELLGANPVRPFVLHLPSGKTVEVPHRDFAAISPTGRILVRAGRGRFGNDCECRPCGNSRGARRHVSRTPFLEHGSQLPGRITVTRPTRRTKVGKAAFFFLVSS